MTVRVNKPQLNIRDKLNELDYGHVPYDKMPAGTIIQNKIVSRSSDLSSSTLDSTTTILSMDFKPYFSNSLIELHSDASYGVQSNVDVAFRYAYTNSQHNIGTVEIERTGRFLSDDNQIQDAFPSRNNWTHYYYPNSDENRTYYYQGIYQAGSGLVWYHTYGSSTTSYFRIREIKQ